MSEDKTPYNVSAAAQVTNYDTAAETLAGMRAALPPRLLSDVSYAEAAQLRAAVLTLIERYEMVTALDRLAGRL